MRLINLVFVVVSYRAMRFACICAHIPRNAGLAGALKWPTGTLQFHKCVCVWVGSRHAGASRHSAAWVIWVKGGVWWCGVCIQAIHELGTCQNPESGKNCRFLRLWCRDATTYQLMQCAYMSLRYGKARVEWRYVCSRRVVTLHLLPCTLR